MILATPTMRWLIISGALHNFNMYAIGAFITPFLMRYHEIDIQSANFVSMIVYGIVGAPGLLLGGFIGDAVMTERLQSCFHSVPVFRARQTGRRHVDGMEDKISAVAPTNIRPFVRFFITASPIKPPSSNPGAPIIP